MNLDFIICKYIVKLKRYTCNEEMLSVLGNGGILIFSISFYGRSHCSRAWLRFEA